MPFPGFQSGAFQQGAFQIGAADRVGPSKARFYFRDELQSTLAALTASSSQSGFPVAWTRSRIVSKRWRSAIGWTIDSNNNKIDFDRSGHKVATIASGTYLTGALLAAAIVTALEAADSTPVWACSYNATTHLFTISSDMSFTLLWATGANALSSPARDLGFIALGAAAANSAAGTSAPGSTAVYQGRHWLKVDLGSAKAVQAGIVHGHNLSEIAVVTLQGNPTDAWHDPRAELTLAGLQDAPWIGTVSTVETLRYWRLVIDDVSNSDGYADLGWRYLGQHDEPTITYSTDYSEPIEDLSIPARSHGGTPFGVENNQPQSFSLQWSEIESGDLEILQALKRARPLGVPLFVALDAANLLTSSIKYVECAGGLGVESAGPAPTGHYYNVSLPLREAL